MLMHTAYAHCSELVSDVSGLGLEKKYWASASSSASLFLASASCPAGLVNIPGLRPNPLHGATQALPQTRVIAQRIRHLAAVSKH